MSEDCIFCRIADGDIPARVVAETEHTVAFLDANPLARGHTLVVPRDHHERVADMPDDVSAAVFAEVHRLAGVVGDAVDADGLNIGVNDGETAGQEVPHVHVHLVPRFEGDGGAPIHAVAGARPDLSDDELDAVADAIRGE